MSIWLSALLVSGVASAHGGGLDKHGCHHERSTGKYHCHRPAYNASTHGAHTHTTSKTSQSHPVAPVKHTHTSPQAAQHTPPKMLEAVPHGTRVGCRYTVGKSDSLTVIAKDVGVSVIDLIQWNHIYDPSKVMEGTELFVTADCAHEVAKDESR